MQKNYLKCNPIFIRYLKSQYSFNVFINHLKNDLIKIENAKWKNINTFCKDLDMTEYITHSFYWDETNEGYIYWEWFNKNWLEYLKKYYKK